MKSSKFNRFVIALTGVLVLSIGSAYAGSAFSDARAYLRQGSPSGAGKVYVSTSSSTPAASSYKACNTVQTSETTTPSASAQVKGEKKTTTYHFWAVANAGYIFTGWYDSNGNLLGSGAAHVSGSVTSGQAGGSDTHAYLDYHASFIKQIQMSFITPPNGSYTITHCGTEVTPAYSSFTTEGKVVLSAMPADGYKLRGWYTTTNGGATKNYFAFGTTCEPNFTSNVTIGADFVADDGKATFWNKNNGKIYNDLNTANSEASSGHVIVAVSDGVLGAGTYTIKAGVTLLIPFDETYNLMTTPKVNHMSSGTTSLSLFRKLTLAPGAVINCSGNICVGGQMASVNGGSASSYPMGACGMLDLSRGGTVNLKSGSVLYAWGFVKGQDMEQGNNTEASGVGKIVAESGATVWEDFQVGEWRGGTASSTIYSNKGSWKFFPFQSYTIQNVEAPVEYQTGSKLKCYWAIFGNGQTFTVPFTAVGASADKPLFVLGTGGTMKKWYDPTTDRVCYELGGGASIDAIQLSVMGESVSSSDYYLPIPANMHIALRSGCTLNLTNAMTMHAGSVVEVKSGATLNINARVHMFDQEDWGTYCMYAYYYRTYRNLTSHYNRGTGTSKASLEDATLIVDGTVNVGNQMLYATAHGANICGNGGGTLKYGTLAGNKTITQCTNLSDANSVNIRSANLHNDNDSYTMGIASTTFKNVNGRWFTDANSTWKSDKTFNFTYIKSGDVYGTAGTNGTVKSCYSKDKTGLELQDKWANVKAEGCTDWFVGIDDDHLYNYTRNTEWHQYIKTGTVGEGMAAQDVYAGSDGKLFYKFNCDITEEGTIDANCLYTVDAVQKALVNGSFVAVTANGGDDHGYHATADASSYYLCFDGCVWHPATRNEENRYTVDGQVYIWYDDDDGVDDGGWLAVQLDGTVSLYYSLSSTNVKIYYEYIDHAWELATPVAEVVTASGTDQVYSLANAISLARDGGTNVTIRLLKNISGTISYTGANNCGLDLNGFTLSSSSSNMITVNHASANFIIKDQSAAGTGKINAEYSSSSKINGLKVTKGHIILNSGTVHVKNTHATAGATGVTVASGYKFTINGGTLEVESKGETWGVHTEETTTSVVTVNGGTIDTKTTSTSAATDGIHSLGGHITINGGTISTGNTTSTTVKSVNLTNANSTLTISGGTITTTAKGTDYGVYVTAGSTANINGGTITATATGGTVRGILSYGTLTMNGGTVNATAGGSDSRALFLRNNTSTINAGTVINATAASNAYGIYYDNGTPTVTVNNGTFTVSTTSTTGAYGVYAAKGTGTINDGTFTVTAKTTGAEGMHVETANTPKLTVNGGKFMVKNSDGAANGVINNTAAAAANFSLAGGYFNIAPAGSYIPSGKSVKDVDSGKEKAIYDAGYVKKIAGNEYTVTWMSYNGKVELGKTQVESDKVPVCPYAIPDQSTSTATLEAIGWSTEKKNGGDKYTYAEGLPAIVDADVTYFVRAQTVYAEVIAGGSTTRYSGSANTAIQNAWNAAKAYTNATLRILSNYGTEAAGGKCLQLVFNPTNANSTLTFDLNGHSWVHGSHGTASNNKDIFLHVNPAQANCKLIITDNSASGNGYLMNTWAKTDGDLKCVEVKAGELVLQKGGIKVKNTDADHYSLGVVVSGDNAHFTMTGGMVYATDGKSPRGVYVANGYADIAGGTVEAMSKAGEAYALLCYDTVNVSADAVIKATGTTGSAYGLYCNGASAILTVDSCTVESKGTGWVQGVYAISGGKIVIDGNPTISSMTTTSSGAFGVFATGANTNITVNSGTFTVKAVTTAARGIYASSTGTATIKGGSFNVTSEYDGDPSSFGAYTEGGTINIEGGNFTLNVVKANQNADLVRCGSSATAYLNVSGGTFTSEKGYYGVRSFGGETTVTGNPVFTAHRGIGAGEWAEATGTAKVTIDGGTYNCTVGYALLSKTHTNGDYVVTGDVTVLDGKFHTLSSVQPIDASQSADYLKVKGGYFTSYTSDNVSNLNKYVVAPSTTTAVESTDPMYASPNDYRYRVNTKFTVTWKDMAGNTLKTEQYNRNEIPSYGSDYVPSDGNTYTFNGWSPTPSPVQSNQIYTAQYTKYEAEVYEGENPTSVRFEHFTDAWSKAQNLPIATIKLISNVSLSTQLALYPDSAAGSKPLTLDLNNHTLQYTGSNDRFIYLEKTDGKLIIKDSSVGQGGQIKVDVSRDAHAIAVAPHKGTLELQSGTIYTRNTSSHANATSWGVYLCQTSSFIMTGGHVEAYGKKMARGIYTESTGTPTVHVSGGTILASTEINSTWGNNAYGIHAVNGSTITVSGTADITAHANQKAYGVYAEGADGNPGQITIQGGNVKAIVEQNAVYGAYAAAYGKINIEGGAVDGHSNVADVTSMWNVEGVHVAGNGTVHISGGTVTSSNGASPIGVSVHGGSTTISGGTFSSERALHVVDYPAATQTATVLVTGGTFIGTKYDAVRVEGRIRDGSIKNNANVTINGGYFYSEGGSIISLYNESGATASTLVLNGGKYCEKSGTTYKDQISARKGGTTTITNISETVGGKTYSYQLMTKFNITWQGGSTYSKVDQIECGLVPSNNDLVGKSFVRNDSTFYFTGWAPTPTAVTGDATYNAVGDYHVASVKVGAAAPIIYDDFDEAWEYAMTQTSATITLLNNVTRTSTIIYTPEVADGRHTLDLNNFTITDNTTDRTMLVNRTDAKLTITDNSSAKGGRLYKKIANSTNIYGIVVYRGEVIMAGGKIYCENEQDDTDWHPAIGLHNLMDDNSKITVTGGTVEAVAKTAAYGICGYGPVNVSDGTIRATVTKYSNARALSQQTNTATITGGTFEGIGTGTGYFVYAVVADAWIGTTVASAQSSTVNISGGTFNVDVENYAAFCVQASASAKNFGGTNVTAHGTMTITGGTFNVRNPIDTVHALYAVYCQSARAFDDATPHHILAEAKGVMNISGGTFTVDTRNDGAWVANRGEVDLIRTWGTLNISGGTFSMWQNTGSAAINVYRGKTTISGNPVFNVRCNTGTARGIVAAPWNEAAYCDADMANNLAEIEVNGGTFNVINKGTGNTYGAFACGYLDSDSKYAMSGKITINDGTFNTLCTQNADYWPILLMCDNSKVGTYGTATANIVVNGGKFKSRSGTEESNTTYHATNAHTTGNIVLTGGYYEVNSRLANIKADTCDVIDITSAAIDPEYNNGYRYKIITHYEAKVRTGETERNFLTIKGALDYACTVANPTITLLNNCTLTGDGNYTINPTPASWTGTLDLNNYTLTPTIHAENGRAFTFSKAECKLVITDNSDAKGGKIDYQGSSSATIIYIVVNRGEVELAGGTLSVENTHASAGANGVVVDGNPSYFKQSGGTFIVKANGGARGYYGKGTATFTGGTMNVTAGDAQAIGLFADVATSVLSVSDTFALNVRSSLADSYGVLVLGSTASGSITGGKFTFNQNNIVSKQGGTFTISGGYFCEHPSVAGKYRAQIDNLNVSGTEVISLTSADSEYADGYRYVVSDEAVAKVTTGSTTTYYRTAKAALDYAKTVADPTVTLLANCTLTDANYTIVPTPTTWTGTLDLNNFTLTPTLASNGRAFTFSKAGCKLVITDKSGAKGGKIAYKGSFGSQAIIYFVVEHGEVELANGTLSVENTHATQQSVGFVITDTDGYFTQSGGTFSIKSNGAAKGYYGTGTVTLTGGTMNVIGGNNQVIGLYANETNAILNISGTFELNASSSFGDSYGILVKGASAAGSITGGKFTFNQNNIVSRQGGTFTISGGYFCEHPDSTSLPHQPNSYRKQVNNLKASGKAVIALDEDDAMYIAGYRYIVTDNPVAKVKSGSEVTYYTTPNAAFNYAKARDNAKIIMLGNCTITSALSWNPSAAISNTFDLNGKTISSTTSQLLTINKGDATLTIKDTPGGGSMSCTLANSASGVYIPAGKLILQSGTISATGTNGSIFTVQVQVSPGGSDAAEFEMTGGKIVASATGAATSSYAILSKGSTNASVTISGGEVSATSTGTNAFALTAANGGQITVEGTNNPKISATGATGYTQVARNEGGEGTAISIEGGLFKASHSGNPFMSTVSITGGYFNEYGSTTDYKTQIESRCVAPKHAIALTAAEQAALGEGGTDYKYKIVDAYTLTWTTDGDALTGTYTSGMTAVGATITAPNTPTKAGYVFNAWSPAFTGTMPAANTEYTATWTEAEASVTVSGSTTYYTTLNAAFNYAKTQNNAVVTLLKNVVSTSTYTWAPSSAISNTFDLNGHSLSSTTGTVLGVGKAGATFTIKDTPGEGTISYSSASGNWSPAVHVGNGKLILQSGTISRTSGDGVALGVQVYTTGDATPEFEMTGGKIQTSGVTYAYAVLTKSTGSNYAETTISGGEVSASATGTYAFALTAAYKGEITVKGTNNPKISATNATTGTQVARNEGNGATFTIEGGLFKASHNSSPFNGAVSISGGYFNEYGSTTTYKTQINNRCVSPKHPIELTAAEQAALGEGGTDYKYKVVDAYTLTWTTDGDALTGTYTSGMTEVGATITAPNTPTKTGYTFAGWTPAVAATMPSANTTYTATWTPTTYTLSYDLDGGTVASENPTSYTIESSAITLNNPTKANHVFTGWTGTGLASATMTVTISAGSTGNRSYTATWTEAEASVTVGGATTYYTTVAAAISAANSKTNPTVTMLQDASTTEVEVTAAMTIDLNGKTISSTQATTNTGVFKMNASGKTLTIRDSGTGGKIDHTATISGGSAVGIYVAVGSLRMESGIIYAKNPSTTNNSQAFGIVTLDSTCGLTMTGGTVTANSGTTARGLWLSGASEITNVTVTATAPTAYALQAQSGGSLTVNSGTYTATGATTAYALYLNGGSFTVYGGRFNGSTQDFYRKSGTASISGGYYVHDTSIQTYCADNYYVVSTTEEVGYNYKVAEVANTGFYADIVDVDNTNSKLILNVTGWASGGWPYTINSVEYQKTAREADRTLKVPYTGTPGDNFVLAIQKTGGDLVSSHIYVIPIEVKTSTDATVDQNKNIFIKNGANVTVKGDIAVKNIYVAPGSKLTIKSGKTLTADTIFLRTTAEGAAEMENNGTIAGSTKVVYTRIIKDKDFHLFGLPLPCPISSVRLSDGLRPEYTKGWLLRSYNEARRAEVGADDNNWTTLAAGGTIAGGAGYEMFSASNYYREFYFPVSLPTTNKVAVAYTSDGAAGEKQAGWNALVSPFTHTYTNDPAPEDLVVNWYMDGYGYYEQEIPSSIPPAKPFAFQTSEAGYLSFEGSAIAITKMPRRASEEEVQIQWINLDITDADGIGDQTSIYAHPTRYEQSYKAGIDVAKQSFEASRAILYSSHAFGEMAFAGVADSLLEQGVALTVFSPKPQELTISLRNNRWLDRLAEVWLVDTETGAQIDLFDSDYTFEANEGTTRGRLFLMGRFKAPNIATDIDNTEATEGTGVKAQKLIIRDKMYIRINGQLYDATGKQVNVK